MKKMGKKILEEIIEIGKVKIGKEKGKNIGYHISAEFYGVENISYISQIKPIFNEAIKKGKLNLVNEKSILYHQFNPHGVTAVALLEESHLAVHTWPEYNYLTIDIFSCSGKEKAEKAYEVFKKILKPEKIKKVIIYKVL